MRGSEKVSGQALGLPLPPLAYLTQSPAVSKGLCVVDLHVAGGGHIVHCHTVKIATESSEKALKDQREKVSLHFC